MRLLILGESDSIGMALREPSDAWGNSITSSAGPSPNSSPPVSGRTRARARGGRSRRHT
jgi:hypothetical protein